MEQYEDDENTRRRVLSNSQVLAFILSYWKRRPLLIAGTIAFTVAAVGVELMVPRAAQALVDAAVAGPAHPDGAWRAWGFFVGVALALAALRNFSGRFWNPLAARTMKDMTDEGFRRVQAFSADWHGDTFAGATVRRLSRAMWGYDTVADAIIMWIGPALLVLIGLSVQMMLRWPLIGGFSLAMVATYIAATVALSNALCAQGPASLGGARFAHRRRSGRFRSPPIPR